MPSAREDTEPHPSPDPSLVPVTELINGLLTLTSRHCFGALSWGCCGRLLSPQLGILPRGGLQHLAAPFWQAALSKATHPTSAYLPRLRAGLWLTPSPRCLPKPHGEREGGDKGHGGTCWEPAQPGKHLFLQDSLALSTAGAGVWAGEAACLQILFAFVFCLSFSFSCFLQKGPDAFTLAGLPWPAARRGTRNAVCECVSVCVQY